MDRKDCYCGEYDVICPGGKGVLNVTKDGAYYLFRLNTTYCSGVLHLYCINNDAAVSIGVPCPADGSLMLNRKVSRALLTPLCGTIKFCVLADTPQAALALASPQLSEASSVALSPETDAALVNTYASTDFTAQYEELDLSETTVGYSEEEYASVFVSTEEAVSAEIPTEPTACDNSDWACVTDGQFDDLCADSGAMYRRRDGRIQVAVPISDDRPFPIPSLLRWGIPISVDGRRCLLFRAEEGKLTVI